VGVLAWQPGSSCLKREACQPARLAGLQAAGSAGGRCLCIIRVQCYPALCQNLFLNTCVCRVVTTLCDMHRVSEIRAVNLLEDLCEAMEDYTLATPAASTSSDGGSSSSSSTGQAQQQAAWVKYKGEGSTKVPKAQRCVRVCRQTR
jgi:hypothetical protein